MEYRALANSLDTVDTEAAYRPGTTLWVPADEWERFCPATLVSGDDTFGDAEMVYLYNDEAATAFGIGEVAMQDTGDYAAGNVLRTTGVIAPRLLKGVAQWAVAAGSYAWFLKRGVGQVDCDGNVTAGAEFTSDAAGQVTDVVANADAAVDTKADAFGVAYANDAGAGTLVTAFVNCPGS